MKTNLFFTLLLFAFCGTCYAQTNVSGSIFASTTWTQSGSPYIISGIVVLFDGDTLTIDPGVTIKFNNAAGLDIRGTLTAIGTARDSIEFTSSLSSPYMGCWSGITVEGTTNPLGVGNQITMEYCKCSYATTFINLNIAYHGPYVFRHCYFFNNDSVNYDGGDPTTIFDSCGFESNHETLNYCQFGSTASNCSFINNVDGVNGTSGVYNCYFSGNTGVALSPYGVTSGCTVENNNIGVRCLFNSANDSFVNNNILNNYIGVEIQSYFNGSINFLKNTICNNAGYNVELLTSNSADLSDNCWCITDSATIRAGIYDGYVNNNYGLVSFTPVLNNCSQIAAGVSDIEQSKSFWPVISPNPFTDRLIVTDANATLCEIVLYDLAGRVIFRQRFSTSISASMDRVSSELIFTK